MRILQIEDDAATAQSIELMLMSEGFKVETTDLGEEGADLAKIYDYDAITLDLNLPDIPGEEALRRIRAAGVKTPVLVLTGATKIETKVKCYGLGADDYMTKPFHKDELVCRLRALIRRAAHIAEPVVVLGDLEVDLNAKRAKVQGRYVHLTGNEWSMLELLTLRKGQTLTKDAFMNHLYGGRDEPELKIIDVFICKVRRKLGPAGKMIQTVWGRGYVLSPDVLKPHVEKPGSGRKPSADSIKAKVLRFLGARPGNAGDVIEAVDGDPVSVRIILTAAVREGLIDHTGRPRSYVYRTTEAGKAFLRKLDGEERAAA